MSFLGLYSKQCLIILIIVFICVIISINLYCISISNDWTELRSFYFAFVQRKQLIKEGKMIYKEECERMVNYRQVMFVQL